MGRPTARHNGSGSARPYIPESKYGPFDGKGKPQLIEEIWDPNDPRSSPCLFKLYALLGLHRYNLYEGTNYALSHIEKYYKEGVYACKTLYITCVASDPANNSPQVFWIKIWEGQCGVLDLTCAIAEPRDGPKTGSVSRFPDFRHSFPQWPSDNSFSDTKRFYVVKKSELQDDANDWIRLYVELAIAIYPSLDWEDDDLSNLEIVDVAIESTQDPSEGLNAKNATVYIRFRDPSEARVGMEVDRVAMVRRSYDEESGWFNLTGYCRASSETEPDEDFAKLAKSRRDYDERRLNLTSESESDCESASK
ncbi:unnamed protein product [Microthlaspi erraticum]|uniref:Uncharacterized protein n=1 Tax=Microthlaspi erraticum TaxID=1685480 RepID=A0A6D2KTV3_9BRAS|nr:unnamed protein product [Microthlaspi erraticum]